MRNRILLVPGNLFFCETVELPEEVEPAGLEEFAELTLESLSPFSLEHLYWGCLADWGTRRVWIYAALSERLRACGYEDLESYRQVLPDFVALGRVETSAPALVLGSPQGWTALRPESPDTLAFGSIETPRTWPVKPPPEPKRGELAIAEPEEAPEDEPAPELTEEDAKALIQQALPEIMGELGLPESEQVRALVLFGAEASETERGELRIAYHEANYEDMLEARLPAEVLWQADIRDRGFKAQQHRERQRDQLLWKGLIGLGVAALLLLLLEIGRFGLGFWMEVRRATIAERASQVQRIEGQDRLVHRLERFSANQLQPFLMLAVIDSVRPDDIYFTSVETDEVGALAVEGIGTSSSSVNAYRAALENIEAVESVDLQIRATQAGRVTFELIAYIPDPASAMQNNPQVAATSTAATPPDEEGSP